MLMNGTLKNVIGKSKNIINKPNNHIVANDDNFIHYSDTRVCNTYANTSLSYHEQIILNPGLTFRNITNNTSEPMDITGIVQAMDKQLETRFSHVTL